MGCQGCATQLATGNCCRLLLLYLMPSVACKFWHDICFSKFCYTLGTVVSKFITDRDFFWGKLISNYRRAARRINFKYRDRSVGSSAENLSLQIQILSRIPMNFYYRYRCSKRINSVIISATHWLSVGKFSLKLRGPSQKRRRWATYI